MSATRGRIDGYRVPLLLLVLSVLVLLSVYPVSAATAIEPSKQAALDWLDRPAALEQFGKISDAIWSYAELGLQEYKSSKILADTLEAAGFKVERGLAGMPTCFVGTWGEGRPVIGILGEFDALAMISQNPGTAFQDPVVAGAPGHGCTHNTMGTAGVAAAIAVKEALQKFGLPGTIKFFGSPSEETVISRPYMVRAGLFKDVDAVIDNHGGGGFSTSYGVGGNALFSFTVTFHGKTAHSAGAPWAGVSALDAVELMNDAVNMLREHLYITYRIHYVITEGGEAPNVVPDKATVWYFVRDTDNLVEKDYEKVLNTAKAAALATGCTYDVRLYTAVHQSYSSKAAAELYQKNIELVGYPKWSEEDIAFAKALQRSIGAPEVGLYTEVKPLKAPSGTFIGGGSSDGAEVTLVAPTASISFPSSVPGAIGHHWSTVAAAGSPIAHKGLIAGAKAMAASAVDLLTKPEELLKLRAEFEKLQVEHPYKCYIPEGTEPPLDMYQQLMAKYRPLMEAFYYDPSDAEPMMKGYTLQR